MDINLLIFKDGQWVYRNADQHVLVNDCATLLNWDLFPFDRWLFDSQNWTMYTRRRQDLIALRNELAVAYGKAREPSARELMIVTFCMWSWKSTRAIERKECPEVRDLERANGRAKVLYKTLKLTPHARKLHHHLSWEPATRKQLSTLAYGH